MVTLARGGLPLIVVSNQRGVSLGLVSPQTLRAIEERIQARLRAQGCEVSAFRYCPHGLQDGCSCRKPRPGMLLAAARELDIDLSRSWMVGDSPADIEAGRAAGTRTIRIAAAGGPPGWTVPDLTEATPGWTVPDLTEAAALILGPETAPDVPAVGPARHGIR